MIRPETGFEIRKSLSCRQLFPDTAIRLACHFGTSPQFWMNLQGRYDLDVAEDQHADRIKKEVHPHAA